jgi:hypothetical protein
MFAVTWVRMTKGTCSNPALALLAFARATGKSVLDRSRMTVRLLSAHDKLAPRVQAAHQAPGHSHVAVQTAHLPLLVTHHPVAIGKVQGCAMRRHKIRHLLDIQGWCAAVIC